MDGIVNSLTCGSNCKRVIYQHMLRSWAVFCKTAQIDPLKHLKWSINFASANGLVKSGNKPSSKPMLTQICHHIMPQRVGDFVPLLELQPCIPCQELRWISADSISIGIQKRYVEPKPCVHIIFIWWYFPILFRFCDNRKFNVKVRTWQ